MLTLHMLPTRLRAGHKPVHQRVRSDKKWPPSQPWAPAWFGSFGSPKNGHALETRLRDPGGPGRARGWGSG